MTVPYIDDDRLISAILPRLKRLNINFIVAADLQNLGVPVLISDFGSKNGMAVAPMLDPAPTLTESRIIYNNTEIPISRVNVDYLESCSDDDITDMLTDWGYFGPADRRPSFIVDKFLN